MKNKLFFLLLVILIFLILLIFISDVKIVSYAVANLNSTFLGG